MIKKGKNRHLTLEMVYNMDNIRAADKEARKGKTCKYGVRKFDKNREENLIQLRKELMSLTYKTMQPVFEERFCDTKVRVLSKVHYRYHVAHHALMRIILPTLEKSYYYESSAAIKNRGIHYTKKHIEKYIRTRRNIKLYQVQVDFVKFYHHIQRDVIYNRLCKEFTNKGIRYLLKDIIYALGKHNGLYESDGTEGMGIGLYPTQPLINFYLNDLDRGICRIKKVKLFRYCDNLLMISPSKKSLEKALSYLSTYANNNLKQAIHTNYGIQTIDDRHPINFVGYKIYPMHTFVRNKTKYKFINKIKNSKNDTLRKVLVSYKGWLGCCNSLSLWKKITKLKSFNGFSTKPKKRYKKINKKYKFIKNKQIYIWQYNHIKKCLYIPKKVKPCQFVLMKEKQKQSKECLINTKGQE